MSVIHDLVDRCREFFPKRRDHWEHTQLLSKVDILYTLAQTDTEHRALAVDYCLVAAFYASVIPTGVSVDYHLVRVRTLVEEDYDPRTRYTSLREEIHGSVSYKEATISRDKRKLLDAFDRFTLRYPGFDYQQFFDVYFPCATELPDQRPEKLTNIILFPTQRTA
ncbi:MAG: hypothetical protein AABX98_05885 [Nanoarchaeota archaeon]